MKTLLQSDTENRTVLEKDFGRNGQQRGAALVKDFGQSGKQRGKVAVKDGQNGKQGGGALILDGKISNLTDSELYKKCQEYGLNARVWMRRFAGLLQEVYRRHLYKRKGYASIHEFAAKLAGMNERTVDKILNLAEKLKDKPKLLSQLETGKVGWSNLDKVATIANPETDSFWAEKAKSLPQRSLEAYVHEYQNRYSPSLKGHLEQESNILQDGEKTMEKFKTFSFPISSQLEGTIRLLKQKLEKERKQTLTWNEVFLEMARGYKEKQELEKVLNGKQIIKKEITTDLCPECTAKKENEREENHEVTRYIPSEPRKVITARSEGKCEFPNCCRPGEIYHHTRRFSLKKNHDPAYIRFLCRAHEGILQSGLIENEEQEPELWNIKQKPDWWDLKNIIDERVALFRREPILKL